MHKQRVDDMSQKILVVDDESDTLESTRGALEMEGYEVHCVNSGKECLKKIKGNKYDLIILDIFMPDLSGEELLKILRKTINHLIPVMYSTIKPKAEVNLKEIDGFIQKPFEKRDLLTEVKEVIVSFNPLKKR